jgi:hypothetical protein
MKYTWKPAVAADVEDLVCLADLAVFEIDSIFIYDRHYIAANIATAVVNQIFYPLNHLVSIARDEAGQAVAWTWAKTGAKAIWSQEPILSIEMAQIDPKLSVRNRLHLVNDMLGLWNEYAMLTNSRIICSTTMRDKQSSYIRLHERNGYQIRGSVAYKRLG